MKKEKQIRETKRLIVKALIGLLEDVPYMDISVKKLCDAASVSRMSFYRHFDQIDDVVRYVYILMNEKILESLDTNNDHSFSRILMTRLTMLKNNDQIRLLISNKQTLDLMFEYSKDEYIAFNHAPALNDLNQYEKDFIVGGLEYMIRKWLSDGMKEDVASLLEKFGNLTERVMGSSGRYD